MTAEIEAGGGAAVIRVETARRRSAGGGDGAGEIGEVERSAAVGRRPKITKNGKRGSNRAAGRGGERRRN
jgi:hypothetical protein